MLFVDLLSYLCSYSISQELSLFSLGFVVIDYRSILPMYFKVTSLALEQCSTGAVMQLTWYQLQNLNTLRPRRNGRHFTHHIFKCIFFNENVWISIKFHWSLFLGVQLTIFHHWLNLVQIMAWHRAGDKPLSEPMMDRLLSLNELKDRPQGYINHTMKQTHNIWYHQGVKLFLYSYKFLYFWEIPIISYIELKIPIIPIKSGNVKKCYKRIFWPQHFDNLGKYFISD